MNPVRGEVPLQLGDKTYTLKMGINALCAAEPLLGKKARAILDELEDDREGAGLDTIRVLAWAGLRRHHPDIHLIEVGEMMEEHGAPLFQAAIHRSLAAAFGLKAQGEGEDRPNPPKRRKRKTGTG